MVVFGRSLADAEIDSRPGASWAGEEAFNNATTVLQSRT